MADDYTDTWNRHYTCFLFNNRFDFQLFGLEHRRSVHWHASAYSHGSAESGRSLVVSVTERFPRQKRLMFDAGRPHQATGSTSLVVRLEVVYLS